MQFLHENSTRLEILIGKVFSLKKYDFEPFFCTFMYRAFTYRAFFGTRFCPEHCELNVALPVKRTAE